MFKFSRKLSAILIGVALSLTLATVLAVHLLQKQLNAYIFDLSAKLSQEIGHQVTIGAITSGWDWGYLKVTATDIVVSGHDTPILMADSIVGKIDLIGSLVHWYPRFSNIILKSPRVVLDWNGLDTLTLSGLHNQSALGGMQPEVLLQLLAMQRHITIIDGDLHLQGKDGADLPFMQMQVDFVDRGNFEYRLVARGTIAAPNPPEFTLAINYQGDLLEFQQALINFEVKTSRLPLEDLINFIPQYDQDLISGSFQDFDLKGTVQNGQIKLLKSEFNIERINISDLTIDQGLGRVEYHPENDKIKVSGNNLALVSDRLYTNKLHIDQFSGDFENLYDQDSWYILSNNLEIRALGMELLPKLKAKIADGKIAALELSSEFKRVTLPRVLQLLPDKLVSTGLYTWLQNSLISGSIADLNLVYIPERYKLEIGLANTEVKYSSNWPSIKNLNARLTVNNNHLNVLATKATIDGQTIEHISGEYPITAKPWQPIVITGSISSTLENGLQFLAKTPLKGSLGDKLSKFDPVGAMQLDLALSVDVNAPENAIELKGNVHLDHASLNIADMDLGICDMVGDVQFTNDKVQANKLRFNLLGHAAIANIRSVDSQVGGLEIDFRAPLQMQDVKRVFPAIAGLRVSGSTLISGLVQIPWRDPDAAQVVRINSDLQGIEIDYPAPFMKHANDTSALQLQYKIRDTNTLSLDLDQKLSANLFVRNGEFFGGNVLLGPGKAEPKIIDSLAINGSLDNFVWQEWQPYINTEDNFAVMPLQLDVKFGNLTFKNTQYQNTRVKYDSAQRLWAVENDMVNGEFSITDKQDKLTINLQRLNINTKQVKNNDKLDFFREKHVANELPLVQFFCEDLVLNDREYRKVVLQLFPRPYGYEINDFSIANDNILLQAQGQWQMQSGEEFTQLSGNIYTKNFGNILRDWQFGNSITRGAGELNFSLEWPGDPAAFDHLQLKGASHFDLRNGSLTGVKPGLGRLIGLLNLDAIQRRLQLDFSDVTDKGLVFDKLIADFKFADGRLESNNILINSPSARIELDGNLNLKSQLLDFNLYVTPKIGAGLPVVAAIAAANPAVGAAVWLVDKAAGSKLSEINKYRYKVSGNLEKPKIEEVLAENKGR